MNQWRLHTLTGEVVRNLTASWSRLIAIVALVAGLVGALTWSELTATDDILTYHRDVTTAGGNVIVASHPQRLPAERCEPIAQHPAIIAAGSAETAPVSDTNISPGTFFQIQQASPGALQVWGAGPGVETALAHGLVIGSATADELGLADGNYLGIEGQSPLPVYVVDVERRSPQTQRSIIKTTVPAGRLAACWVETRPGSIIGGEILLADIYADTGDELSINRWMRLGEFARDPVAELANRPQTQAWLVAGAIITLLFWLDLWFRRSSLSLYRILGTTRTSLLYQAQLETILVVTVAALLGYLWATTAHHATTLTNASTDQLLIAARTTLSTILIPITLAPLPALLTGGRNGLLNQLKDR